MNYEAFYNQFYRARTGDVRFTVRQFMEAWDATAVHATRGRDIDGQLVRLGASPLGKARVNTPGHAGQGTLKDAVLGVRAGQWQEFVHKLESQGISLNPVRALSLEERVRRLEEKLGL